MRHATCDMRHATCDMRHATGLLDLLCDGRVGRPHPRAQPNRWYATCSMRHAACNMQHATCNVYHATCNMQHVPCTMHRPTSDIRHATCDMRHATCALVHELHLLARIGVAGGAIRLAAGDVLLPLQKKRTHTAAAYLTIDPKSPMFLSDDCLMIPGMACTMQHATCDMRHATCTMRHAACDMRHAPCDMRHASSAPNLRRRSD